MGLIAIEGELDDLIEEFSEGRVQFAYVKVTDPNTGLPKNVLIAWCGEGVPERTKGYFTSHLATVSKLLHVRCHIVPDYGIFSRFLMRASTNAKRFGPPGIPCPDHSARRW